MTTSTLDPRVSLDDRGGADLYRFRMVGKLSQSVDDVTVLAKESDGSVIVPDVDLLKVGVFNGLDLRDGDLEAMAERFADLRDGGVFVPPFRLDHSWSILSVIGYFEEIHTYTRLDETDGISKTFLAGSIRVTGSLDYTVEQILSATKRGALRARSSELGYYETNAGIELPLVFYGAAYVDIPAVEGLDPVKLAKVSPEPHSVVNLNTEGSVPVSQPVAEPAQTPDETPEGEVTPGGVETEGSADVVESGTVEGTEPETEAETEPADDETEGEDADPVNDAGETEDEDETEDEEPEPSELDRARAEVVALKRERAETELARFQASGVVVPATLTAARTLLAHDSDDVRAATRAILGHVSAPVKLGAKTGTRSLSADQSVAGDPGGRISLSMEPEEVGVLWANLTTEERKARQGEYDAWRNARRTG